MAVLIWMIGGTVGLFMAGSGIGEGDPLLILAAVAVLLLAFIWGGYEKRRRDARRGERAPRQRFYIFTG